jgi:NAD(P)-dependent dehydrogenase (short-subunit alcohol dehydrogenase family)
MAEYSVKDTVIFITGASKKKGIGRALLKEALKRGAKKVYASARQISEVNDVVAEDPTKVFAVELDVTSYDQVRNAADEACDTQILINNAGTIGLSGCIENYNENIARQELEVNYLAPLRIIHEFSKNLIKNRSCAIVNIISIGGLYPSPAHLTYSASKAALYSLTLALRIEMARRQYDISVFGAYPGPIDTDLSKDLNVSKASPEYVASRIFDGMEKGVLDITTDELSDKFDSFLKKDPNVIAALKQAFAR